MIDNSNIFSTETLRRFIDLSFSQLRKKNVMTKIQVIYPAWDQILIKRFEDITLGSWNSFKVAKCKIYIAYARLSACMVTAEPAACS